MKHLITFLTIASSIALAGCNNNSHTEKDDKEPLYLLTGSYSDADSPGIRMYSFDPVTGAVDSVSELRGVANPSFQTVSPEGIIYSVSEEEGRGGAAYAISFDRENGQLSLLGFSLTLGNAPCYIKVSPDGRFVVTANYLGGNLTVFPLDKEGKLLNPIVTSFEGKGPVVDRQDQPHLHCISFTPDSTQMLATDLGTDCIHRFTVGGDSLIRHPQLSDVELKPGSGPRHIVWNNDGNRAYLINEISGEVSVLSYDGTDLTPIQYIVADSLGAQGSGDIRMSPDGRHLYASNRLKGDGLAIFSVNPSDGTLTHTGYQLTGPHPRNFIISPDGRYVLVACRDNDTIEIYRRDPNSGKLTPSGNSIHLPRPVCLTWI